MTTLYKFTTGGREVAYLDADDAYQPEDIRTHWAGTFPELGNASTDIDAKKQTVTHEGKEVEVDRVVSFAKKAGTKGMLFPSPLSDLIDIYKSLHPGYETIEVEPNGTTPNQLARDVQRQTGGGRWSVGWVDWKDGDVVRLHRRKQ